MNAFVKDVMTTQVVWVEQDTPFAEIAAALRAVPGQRVPRARRGGPGDRRGLRVRPAGQAGPGRRGGRDAGHDHRHPAPARDGEGPRGHRRAT